MNKEEIIKALEDGYKTLTKEETLEEKSFRMGYQMALDKMFYATYINYKYSKRIEKAIEKAIEYIDKHTIEWKDDKFEDNNIMIKFNEYSNPQELKNILGGDE